MKVVIVAIVSFLIGAFASTIYLSDELESNENAIGEMVALTKGYIEKLDKQRTIDRLEEEIKTLSYLVASEQNGTPFEITVIDMAKGAENQVQKVTSMLEKLDDQKMKDKAKELIEKETKIVEDVRH